MSADVVVWLESELGRVEELARALPPGPWQWVEVDDDARSALGVGRGLAEALAG